MIVFLLLLYLSQKLSVCITGHPDVTCHASVGETVVLPCTSTFPEELNISHSKLYWQKGDDLVHFFHKGHDDLESQDEQYHGRTSLFLNEVKHGNFSLKLSNVQLQDKAVYSCIYSQAGHQTKKSQIKLSVSGKNLFLGQREGGIKIKTNPCLLRLLEEVLEKGRAGNFHCSQPHVSFSLK
uniref:Ig-like domain-containing protein n=1 Tax=Gallus gallus TaxID=9031 RepID=A0A8V0YKA4_CHICK